MKTDICFLYIYSDGGLLSQNVLCVKIYKELFCKICEQLCCELCTTNDWLHSLVKA